MIPPQLTGSPSYLQPGTPALAKFLPDLGYNTGEFGKNHLGDHTASLPTAHGFQTYPPLQAPATYNLDGILKAIQANHHGDGLSQQLVGAN